MSALRHVWYIAAKDLKLFVTDRIAMGSFLLFPFLFVALFSFVLGGVTGADQRFVLHMVTEEDNKGFSRHILDALETDDVEDLDPGEPVFVRDPDYETAYQAVERDESQGFLCFPEDFTDGLTLEYGSTPRRRTIVRH